jgi:hypothetical protein
MTNLRKSRSIKLHSLIIAKIVPNVVLHIGYPKNIITIKKKKSRERTKSHFFSIITKIGTSCTSSQEGIQTCDYLQEDGLSKNRKSLKMQVLTN